MNLVIDVTATDLSNSAVNGLSDLTPVANLQDIVLGDNLPLTITFTDGSGGPSWAGNAAYTLSVGLGTLDANGGADYTGTTSFTTITQGWTGFLPLTTQLLIDALALQVGSAVDWTRFPTTLRTPYPRPYGGYFVLQIRVIDPTGMPVTYAELRVFLRSRIIPQSLVTQPTYEVSVLADYRTGVLIGPKNFFTANPAAVGVLGAVKPDGTSIIIAPDGTITAVGGGGGGGVSIVSVVSANGVSGTVANPTTTPAITLTLGAITPTSVNALTLAAQSVGFTIAGGTTSKTLTVSNTASVSGTNTGDQTSVSGNAGTATALQTARAINGVNFDGTAAITVAAAAGTLTGATLASGVTTSSLTSLGTIANLIATAATIGGVGFDASGNITGITSLTVTTLDIQSLAIKADALEASLFAADAGTTDDYVITLSPAISAYVPGVFYSFKANTANTGAATLNINGLGAKTIKKVPGGITTDLATNDIRAGQWVIVTYDGTNFQMQSLLGNAPAGAGTVTSVDHSFTGGLITASGGPITGSGTLALTVAGTSGGVPYFASGTTWASSAALAANALVVGGGAGAAPATITTGTGILTALGINVGSAGAPVVFNGAGGTPSSITLTNATGTAASLTAGNASLAANLSGTPALPNGTTATTQSAASNDTKLATDAYVDRTAQLQFNAQTGSTYTLVLTDGNPGSTTGGVSMSNASANTLTVPTNASVAFPVGWTIPILQLGTGATTIAAAGGVTINSPGGYLTIGAQNAIAVLVKTATNTWQLTGSLSLPYAFGRITAQSAAVAITGATITVGASDSSYRVSGNINVTAATVLSTSLNCVYTDETNTSRTMIVPLNGLAGNFVSGGLATSTGPFESATMHIRCKAGTTVTLSVASGTFTGVTYNAEGYIQQIQ